jgi:hypothetical protein
MVSGVGNKITLHSVSYAYNNFISLERIDNVLCTTYINIKQLCTLHADSEYIYSQNNSDHLLKHRQPIYFCSGDVLGFVWNINWII